MPINNITQTISTLPEAGHRGVDVQTQFVIKQEDFQDHLQGTTVTELNTLKDQLNSRISEINSTVTTMNGYAGTASAGASTATTKAGEASTSASEALTSRNQASTFATNSSASATKASQWSDNNYNVEVETGRYSAKHWSTVAQNTVNNKIDKVTSTDNAIVRFDGVTGQIQNSGVVIDDSNNVGIGTSSILLSAGDSLRTTLTIKGKGTTASGGAGVVQLTSNASGNLSPLLGNYEWHISDNTNSTSTRGAFISVSASGSTVGNMGTYMTFATKQDGVSNAGKEAMLISASGDILAISGTGRLGYGTGSGGTVTQLTSKGTAVTLNKPTGQITMNSAALAAGVNVSFTFTNSLIANSDILVLSLKNGSGSVNAYKFFSECANGNGVIQITNISGISLAEAIVINFAIIKGAVS